MCVCVSGDSAECAEVNEVYDTMSCLPIASDRAATEGSKYFKLGQQPHEFFLTQNTCSGCRLMLWMYILVYVVTVYGVSMPGLHISMGTRTEGSHVSN